MSMSGLDKEKYDGKWENMWTAGPKGLQAGDAFDENQASRALSHTLQTVAVDPTGKRILVPGCGRGYDVEEFVKFGASCATGLEIAPAAVKAANSYLTSVGVDSSKGRVVAGDFFKFPDETTEPFDFGYDYTFLCALHPDMREDWAKSWSKLIKPGGELITLVFPVVEKEGGPPWAVHPDLYTKLLVPNGFKNVYLEAVPEKLSHPGREGKEFLARWKKL